MLGLICAHEEFSILCCGSSLVDRYKKGMQGWYRPDRSTLKWTQRIQGFNSWLGHFSFYLFCAYITMWYSKHSMSEKFDLETHLSLLMTYIFKTILLILKRTFKKGEFFYDQNLPSLNTSSMKFLSFVILKVYFSYFYARLILKITFYEYGRG